MADLVVVVPSRGRPEAARTLVEVFRNTTTADTFLAFAVNQDDPQRAEYETVGDAKTSGVLFTPSRSMVEALNLAAVGYASLAFAVGFMGDDHCPRTLGWDEHYLAALHQMGTGIVYGNDLLQGENLPTQCAMTADIVAALGYICPPGLVHLYVDDFWRDLGRSAGRLRYLPDVIVEHRHPLAGKAAWDAGYVRVNDAAMYERDRLAYEAYLAEGFDADVLKVKALHG